MGPKILFFSLFKVFLLFFCLFRVFCLFLYSIMCISTLRWVLFRNAILLHPALSYKHFKVLRNGRVVSALVCETEVVRVMSSVPDSNHLLLHIFLYRMVPKSSFETMRPWKSDFLDSISLTIFVTVRYPMYQSGWNLKYKLVSHVSDFLQNLSPND
jgi:hypothetical protein